MRQQRRSNGGGCAAGWTQRVLAVVRFGPLLHLCITLAATALMFLSSAAALCSCVLCFQTVAAYWAEAGGAGGRSGAGGPGDRVGGRGAGGLAGGLPTAQVLWGLGRGDGAESERSDGGAGARGVVSLDEASALDGGALVDPTSLIAQLCRRIRIPAASRPACDCAPGLVDTTALITLQHFGIAFAPGWSEGRSTF